MGKSQTPSVANRSSVASLRHTLRLWKVAGLSPWKVLYGAWQGYRRDHFDARSAQFAYYALLAVFPLLILLIAAAAHLPVQGVLETSMEAAGRGLPHEMYDLLEQQIRDIQRHSSWRLLGVNLLLLAVGGTRLVLTIIDGLNLAYGVPETRRFWQTYGMAFLLTIAASLLALMAMSLMVLGPLASRFAVELSLDIGWLEVLLQRGVRWGVICASLWLCASTIYWWGPNAKLQWSWLSPGSVAAVGGWVLASQGFRWYVENLANYNRTYGALGGVIVLIVWLDLAGAVLLFGGQINAVIHRAAGLPSAPAEQGFR